MCDLHKQFILCSCKLPQGKPIPEGSMIWRLSSYEGESPLLIEGIYNFPDHEITGMFPSDWVATQLNSRNCFDFDHEPAELDELRIYKPRDAYSKRQYLCFIFRNGEWRPDEFHGWETLTGLKNEGKVKFETKTRLNSIRQFLQGEKQLWWKQDNSRFEYAHQLLCEFEHFPENELENEPEIEAFVDLLISSAAAAMYQPMPDAASLAEIRLRVLNAAQAPHSLPQLPYRRVLSASMYAAEWDRLQKVLLRGKQPNFMFDESALTRWQEEMMANESMLFHFDPMQSRNSHRLSSLWLEEMLANDFSYWTDEDMTWGLTSDGHGYWYTLGSWTW